MRNLGKKTILGVGVGLCLAGLYSLTIDEKIRDTTSIHQLGRNLMARVKIYTTPLCPFCRRAKDLLNSKNISFDEIDVSQDVGLRTKLTEMTGGRTTVPQIFIDDQAIGGFDDLNTLNQEGKLDTMLKN